MPYKIHRIQIATTTFIIGNTEQVYPHHNNSWVYIDHPTSTIQPEWDTPFVKDIGRHVVNFDFATRQVFASKNTQNISFASWITDLKTSIPLRHSFTFTRKVDGWAWHSILYKQVEGNFIVVKRINDSQHWTEPTLLYAVETVAHLTFPLHVDPDLSPDLAEMVRED